jgi:hypothetical protein
VLQVPEVTMTFPADGYHLGAGEGDSWWFLDVRYDVKIAAGQTGGALTLMELARPPDLVLRVTCMSAKMKPFT